RRSVRARLGHESGRAMTDHAQLAREMAELYNQGNALSKAGLLEQAVAVYDQAVEKSGPSDDQLQANVVAFALFNKAIALRDLGRNEDEIATYDQLLMHVSGSTDPVRLHQAARALLNKGLAPSTLGREQEEVEVYEQLGERL